MNRKLCHEEWYRIEFDCDIIVARAEAARLAEEAGFSRRQCREISISVSELGTNIIKYACPGMLSFRIVKDRDTHFEVMAADWGKGITNVAQAVKDYHTEDGPIMDGEGYVRPLSEGLGCGLSAVKRLMDSFRIESYPQRGTRVVAIKTKRR